MPATDSDERAECKDGSDNGSRAPNVTTSTSSSPAARTTAAEEAGPTRAQSTGSTSGTDAPTTGNINSNHETTTTDLLKTAERAEFGSSTGASYSSRGSFGRGYDRRRGGGYHRQSTFLPPPPPQTPGVGVGGGASWTGLRDLDGYTSSAEADIESMASFASHDSREVREVTHTARTAADTSRLPWNNLKSRLCSTSCHVPVASP